MNEEEDIRGFNLKIDNLRTGLANVINSSNLPAGIVYFVLKDVFTEVGNLYSMNANKEYQEFCEQTKEKENEETQSENLD